MIAVTVAPSSGAFSRTRYDSGSGTIKLSPALLIDSSPAHSGWTKVGTWATDDDTLTSVRPLGTEDNQLHWTYYLNQSVATPITLTALISGQGIAPPEDGDLDHALVLHYYDGTWKTATVAYFPATTFTERQFTVTLTPSTPVEYIRPHIYARTKAGVITVRQIEVYEGTTPAAKRGEWQSAVIHVAAADATAPAPTGTALMPERLGFYYGYLDDVDDQDSIDYSVEALAGYAHLVTHRPTGRSARELEVLTRLHARGVRLWGYTSGLVQTTVELMEDAIDEVAADGRYYGVFMDSSFGVRADQIAVVNYAHANGLFFMPNLGAGSGAFWLAGTPTPTLGPGDAALIESFYTRSDDKYAGEAGGELGFHDKMYDYYHDTLVHADARGVAVGGLAYPLSATTLDEPEDQERSLILAALLGFRLWCYGPDAATGRLPWRVPPALTFGSRYLGGLDRVSTARWERWTDEGLLWVEASDAGGGTREAGVTGYRRHEVALAGVEESVFAPGTGGRVTVTLWGRDDPTAAWAEVPSERWGNGRLVAREPRRMYQVRAVLEAP